MPFVNISLARGKSAEYLDGVSSAVHEALVQELGMNPDDRFQFIDQYEPSEMIFNRDFRGGPRSDDFIVFTITEGIDSGDEAKQRFYKTLVDLLQKDPGVRGEDVFVMVHRTPPANFSFASGVSATEIVAAEAPARAGAASTFTKPDLIDAVTELFKANDRTRIVSMLPETFVLKIPETLPYGGSFQGPAEFDRFFQRIYDDHEYWSSFHTELALGRVLDAGTHLVAPLRVTGRAKSSGVTITVENLWLFEIADGNFVRAQLYADTAAGRNV
ncbi:MAG: tautomerase family protein [Streptosporangiaceae bacterium]|jgi:phenylpyruvate tautomerase PptA (4-oxalocrotonate tautomerase family)